MIIAVKDIEQLDDASLHDLLSRRRDPVVAVPCRRVWESSTVVTATREIPRVYAPVIHEILVKVLSVRIPSGTVGCGSALM